MTQTIIHVPASEGGGSFDPTDIELTDNTSGAFLVKEGSNEYIRIDTTNSSEQIVLQGRPGNNSKLVMNNDPYLQGSANQSVQMASFGVQTAVSQSGHRIINKLGHSTNYFQVSESGNAAILKIEEDSSSTFTLNDSNSAVFKVQDDAGSPTDLFKIDLAGTNDIEMNAGTYNLKDGSGNAVLVWAASNSFRFGTDHAGGVGAYRGVGDELIIDCLRSGGAKIVNKMRARGGGHGDKFRVNSASVTNFEVDQDSGATFTLDDASGAVFKIVDDDSSPRTYFTATENGTVEVDGVKVGLGGGAVADNVAVGKDAFAGTQTGFGNSVAVGFEAGKAQVGGYNNTFLGFKTGLVTVNSINNTAVGFACMDGTNGANVLTGADNTGVGSSACRNLTSGAENVGVGRDALNSCTTGANNVGVGMAAGDAIVGGSGNIAIGHDSDCGASGTNQIAIGNGVVENTNNRASIGDSSNVATLDFSSSGNSWSNTSDVRIKENIQDSDLGLAFINSLRPVKHTSKDPAQWPEEIRPAEPSDRTPEQLEAVKDGLIAQEVKAAADALGTSFSGWEQDANGLNRLQYERFVVPLIKAVQELSAQVEELKGDK